MPYQNRILYLINLYNTANNSFNGSQFDYTKIISVIFLVIWACFALMLVHYAVFMVAGIFTRKTFPETDEKLSYGIIIAARNEEKVIGDLIESIRKTNYPQDKLKIFIIAHNCTDNTAVVARQKGAIVYEYNNPRECTVGYAYRYLVDRINEDYGWNNFDGFFIINADNVLTENYFDKMNDAFIANGKKAVVTSYRNSLNFSANSISCLYGIFFVAACRYESRGRTALGCSTRVSGTGYMFPSEFLKDGWEYVTLTEDWEFTADKIADGRQIVYCDEAEFFDEQPTGVKVMLRQRLRWARGHMIVFFTRFKKLMKTLFSRKNKGQVHKFSVYDISVTIMPLGVISVVITILQMILLGLCPLFGCDAAAVWKSFAINAAIGLAVSYFSTVFTGVLLIILERKRIPKVKFLTMLAALLLWPLFLALNIVLDVIALFVRKLSWKVIPHGDSSRKVERRQEKYSDEKNVA